MEHLHHFQLTDDPFRNDPLLRLFFEQGPQQEALRRLERSVRQSKGLSVLVGASGSGKTMVLRQLLDGLEEEVFEATMIVLLHGAADAGWVLSRFARQLGVEEPAPEREKVLAQIYEQLAIVREDGRHAVLIVDDAEALAQSGALAEICGLLKLEYEDRRLLSLVLAGPALLDEAFASDGILGHRIDVRVQLDSLSPEAAAAYLEHRIRQVGGDPRILDNDAVNALHELGSGYPGRMNTLADNAMFEAFLCGRPQLTRLDVERAHRDLGWTEDVPPSQAAKSNGQSNGKAGPPQVAAAPVSETPVRPSIADTVVTGTLTDPGVEAPLEAVAPRRSDQDGSSLQETLDELDSELDSVFDSSRAPIPEAGPPKDEDEAEDLLVELVDG